MEHPSISFARLLAVSVAVHVLICGTALAFAHYGEALFGNGPRVITVDLVGDGGEKKARGTAVPRAVRAERRVPRELDRLQEELPVKAAAGTVIPATSADASGGGKEAGAAGSAAGSSPDTIAGAGAGSGEAAGAAGSPSAEEWRMVRAAIEKAKDYPRLARERGIEGVVLVRFRIHPSGTVERVDVVKSSGASILDDASVKTLRRAGPMPYINGWIEVPLVYELK